MNLYQINYLVYKILQEHMDDDGVISEEGSKQLDELALSKDTVIDELAKEVKNHQAIIDGIDKELQRLEIRKKQTEKHQQTLINIIAKNVTTGEKRVRPEFAFQWTTSSPLKGLDDYDPELAYTSNGEMKKFVRVKESKVTYEFDKIAIKEALKENDDAVPVTVYVDKIKNLKIK